VHTNLLAAAASAHSHSQGVTQHGN